MPQRPSSWNALVMSPVDGRGALLVNALAADTGGSQRSLRLPSANLEQTVGTMIFTPLRKAVIAGAGVVAIGAAGGVAVHAATSSSPSSASLTSSTSSPSPDAGQKNCVPAPALGIAKQVLAIAVKDTGLTQQQILDQLRAGKTFDQIAGSKAQTVENDLLAALKTRLDKAVSNGKLTQDRENTMLDKAKAAIEKAMSSDLSSRLPATDTPRACGRGLRGGRLLQTLISVTAQQTGLSKQQVMQDLRNGESIDQIAGSKAAAIKAAVLQQMQQDLSSQLDQIMSHSGGLDMGMGRMGGLFGSGMRGHGFRGGFGQTAPSPSPSGTSGA